MLILFGQKYLGKDTSEVPSGFLIWIIESFEQADWNIINAAKQELSARIKLDWKPPTDEEEIMRKEIIRLTNRTHQLESLLAMSTICKGNQIILDAYTHNPTLLEQDIKIIQSLNQ